MSSLKNGIITKRDKIIQTYDYRDDKTNEVVYQKVRTEPKGFYIRSRNKNDVWENGLNGNKSILYRLKGVLKADEINIVEGEKDADNLVKLGFAATTNFDGAGKWRPEYNQYFEGKVVIIFPDNDEQGRKHAQ